MGSARDTLEAVWARMGAGDLSGAASYVADDVQVHDGPLTFDNRADFWHNLAEFSEAFSELRWAPVQWTEAGDVAVAEVVFSAVHSGPYLGRPPTGRTISIREAVVVQVSPDGLITHWRSYPDAVSLLGQIGAL
ncbi:MAG TPA: ester cyclase [Acidimicrobiales bacterium]|nr:ester cyclase [Acidimicrobiales bacterium]